jgi:tetratricopeptide (TPR) repeat protein
MGVVYLAQQERPRRRVALKVMRPGTATPELLRRFEREAQTLGQLQHEGVARIYEAATADTGHGRQPYFAMEFIQGQPLTAYADARKLTIAERLRLMIRACQAVQHAHQKGVIHRDLKPANILVEESGQPKVLDFGVARVTESDLPGTTVHTAVGHLVGTLPYMSPEQAAGDPGQVDTLADVYALGVICYELLAGRRPHDLKGLPLPAAVRVIVDAEPPSLGSVNKDLRGDLTTIVAKSLEKDKARRYQSAADFAADLQRYLNDEPVQARPAGTIYHFGKFARRNKALVSAAVILLTALVAGSWLWALTALQRERADVAEKEKARLQADGYVQAAHLDAQRGRWREALVAYDKALTTERHRDSVPLRLEKIQALLAVNEASRAATEIEALAAAPHLGEYEGPVLLLQGDILLGQDNARAERLLRKARTKPLPPAAASYAEALLTERTPEAVKHLRLSLERDAYQPRARAILELLLILLGELREAGSELTKHEALFPEDSNAKVLRAQLFALEGDLGRANAVLDGLRGQLPEVKLEVQRAAAKVFFEVRNPANEPDPVMGLPDVARLMPLIAPAFARLAQLQGNAGPKDALEVENILLPAGLLPPLVRKGLVRMQQAVAEACGSKTIKQETIDKLSQAAAVHPEGLVFYMRAVALFATHRFDEARKAARQAAETPALMPVRRPALFMAAASGGFVYASRRNPGMAVACANTAGLLASPLGPRPVLAASALLPPGWADEGLLRQAVEDLRGVLALGPIRVPFQRKLAISLAIVAKDFNLARQILDDWERQAPGDLEALSSRALVELRAGAYELSLQAAEKVLQRTPGNTAMLRMRQEAVAKLIEQVRRFQLPAPAVEAP